MKKAWVKAKLASLNSKQPSLHEDKKSTFCLIYNKNCHRLRNFYLNISDVWISTENFNHPEWSELLTRHLNSRNMTEVGSLGYDMALRSIPCSHFQSSEGNFLFWFTSGSSVQDFWALHGVQLGQCGKTVWWSMAARIKIGAEVRNSVSQLQ